MSQIGFATGCLHKLDLSLDGCMELYLKAGATAIELTFPTQHELMEYKPSRKNIDLVNEFDYVSLHAPFKEILYGINLKTIEIFNKISEFSLIFPFEGVVIHPDLIKDYGILEKFNLPFLIENMDPRKDFGVTPRDMEKIASKCPYNFVLDIFHAYEFDNSLGCVKDFVEVMENRLQHLHVSGQNRLARHIPLHKSNNKNLIAKSLEGISIIPIISEGKISEPILKSIKDELDFFKQCVD